MRLLGFGTRRLIILYMRKQYYNNKKSKNQKIKKSKNQKIKKSKHNKKRGYTFFFVYTIQRMH